MTIADYAELKLLVALFNNTAFAVTQPYVQLHVGDPGEACTGNTAGDTTRKALSCATAASGTVTSDADLTWTNVSTTETITHVSVWDASTAGNALWSGPMSPTRAVTAGDDLTIPSGQLVVTLD